MKFDELIHRKRLAYHRTFLGPDGKPGPAQADVLADLKRAAGINKGGIVISPISRTVDPYATAYRAGQRDLYLRIAKFLGLDEASTETDND